MVSLNRAIEWISMMLIRVSSVLQMNEVLIRVIMSVICC